MASDISSCLLSALASRVSPCTGARTRADPANLAPEVRFDPAPTGVFVDAVIAWELRASSVLGGWDPGPRQEWEGEQRARQAGRAGERGAGVTCASLLAGVAHKRVSLGRAGRWCPSVGPSVSAASRLGLHLALEPLPGDGGLLLHRSRRLVYVDREPTGETFRRCDGHSHRGHDRPSGRHPASTAGGKGAASMGCRRIGEGIQAKEEVGAACVKLQRGRT